MSWCFASGGQNIELQLQHRSFQWLVKVDFLLNWLVWSPYSSRDSQESFPTPHFEGINSFGVQPSSQSNFPIHTWLLEKNIALTIWTNVDKVMSLLFSRLSSFVIAFLPRSKHLFISIEILEGWGEKKTLLYIKQFYTLYKYHMHISQSIKDTVMNQNHMIL